MATNIGPKIGIDGEAEYRKQLNSIIEQQKTLRSELKLAAAEFSSNADAEKKAAKETEILNKLIENQNKRVDELKKGLEESKKKYGENSTETAKWQRAVNEAETELANLRTELQNTSGSSGFGSFAEALDATGSKLQDIGGKMSEIGGTLSKTVTAPIVGLGAAAMAAFNEVDKGSDILVTKTGASGEALDNMVASMESLATSIPTTFEQAGTAIGEVNTRFGLTGEELEKLSGQFLKFAEINGTDVNTSIDTIQKALSSFGLTAEDAAPLLDTFNKVGQDTGISMDALASGLVANGSVFRELGLNAAESAILLGQLEKSGIDTSAVMTGLSKAQKTAMEDGTSMQEVLQTALSSSGDAIDIFGAKAGPKLSEAFETGIISLDMFVGGTASLDDALGSVSETFDATLDPMDSWATTLNELKVAGAELGSAIGPVLVPMIKGLATAAKDAGTWFKNLDDKTKKNIVTIAGIVAAIGPALSVAGKVVSTVGSIISLMGKLGPLIKGISTAFTVLTGPLGLVAAGIAAAVAVGVLLYKNWDTIKEKAGELGKGISEKWNSIKETTSKVWGDITKSVTDKVGGLVKDLPSKWSSIKDAASTGFGNVKTAIKNKLDDASNAVQDVINSIKNKFKFTWELPKLKMPHLKITGSFSLNPPSVPKFSIDWYRKAYNVAYGFSSPTVLPTASGLMGFGDGPGTEIVIGQNTLMRTISNAVQSAMGYFPAGGNTTSNTYGDTIINVYGAPGQDIEELADIIEDRINTRVQREEAVYA